ncbi:MAG: M24 family metallopeptidase [Cytophagia bacterium]|nr:MAG: M24 family metallopeptidase [Runella sp.]TAG17142.1 MAG: M24 family metallopeptidase [Cytophagales bacterium]TAG36329.1 MAG: M24 family metallopeptidase [Cytophagia bacterium]TAG77878.1 MAG: M24 family metallopeptidase [Cytophagales bacterium]
MKKIYFILLLLVPIAAEAQMPVILAERERARVIDDILEDRLTNLLPQLMRREGVDMWVIISREYNEDPVMKTMLPSTWLSARRRTIMVFFDRGPAKGIEKLAIARYDVGNLLKGEWDINVQPDQWQALVQVLQDRNPKKIALNFSKDYGHADGLTFTEQKELMEKMPAALKSRVVSADRLAVAWLETRTQKEQAIYPLIARISHQIIDEAFSEKVIQPGVTTTDDVVWWLRQRVTDLGLETWFHPTVDVQRYDPESFDHLRTFSKRPAKQVILPGDLLHVDFGITYLRLNTDQQQHAYVLRPNETEVPAFIKKAFQQGNRLQDMLTERFKTGQTGNQMLLGALEQAQKENITASIYSHPIGVHGHAAGPTIGMWDQQKGVPGPGDYPLYENTAYSIELNVAVEIPEWKKIIRIMLEEDGFYDGRSFGYLDGRQTDVFTIPRKSPNVK